MKKAGILLGLIALFAVIGFYVYQRTQLPDVNIDQIELQTFSGIPLNFAGRNDKPLILHFYSTASKTSTVEFSAFKNPYAKFGFKITMIMVSDEEIEKATAFKVNAMLPFYFLHSVKPVGDYGIHTLPATYFFNGKGKLISKKSGLMTEAEIEAEISKITAS